MARATVKAGGRPKPSKRAKHTSDPEVAEPADDAARDRGAEAGPRPDTANVAMPATCEDFERACHARLASVERAFPHRQEQIAMLAQHLLSPSSAPVFVSGPPHSGKSTVTRAVLLALGAVFCWTQPYYMQSEENFLRRTLSGVREALGMEPQSDKRRPCRRIDEFCSALARLLPDPSPPLILVVDRAERFVGGGPIGSVGVRPETLVALARLRELSGVDITVVLISRLAETAMDACLVRASRAGLGAVRPVAFPRYSPAQLCDVAEGHLAREVEARLGDEERLDASTERNTLSGFVRRGLPPLLKAATDVASLVHEAVPLYLAYRRPVVAGKAGPSNTPVLLGLAKDAIRTAVMRMGVHAGSGENELAETARHLLVAAFVASNNELVFTTGVQGRGRKRKMGAAGTDQRDDLVREERLNGPRPFTLDRLLTVHKGLLKAAADKMHADTGEGPFQIPDYVTGRELHADILLAVRELVEWRLLHFHSFDRHPERAKYTCHADRDFVERVARGVGITELQRYLDGM